MEQLDQLNRRVAGWSRGGSLALAVVLSLLMWVAIVGLAFLLLG